MPSGDEGTGLHAFDDLDPVSTVSALSALPTEPPAPAPVASRRSLPPPVPPRSAQPEGRPDTGITGSRVRSVLPPPPRVGVGPRSAPPPPPGGLRPPSAPPSPFAAAPPPSAADSDEDTKVVSLPDGQYPAATAEASADDVESLADEADDEETAAASDGATASGAIADNALLDHSANAVATKIDMEWDEEEVQTQLREGVADEEDGEPKSSDSGPRLQSTGRPSPFPALGNSYPGNPSPFSQGFGFTAPLPASASATNAADNWEDDALTRVISHPMPGLLAPPTLPSNWNRAGADSLSPVSTVSTLVGETYPERPNPLARAGLIGMAAIALLGTGFGVRSLMTNSDPATITLVTRPADAEVSVDGRPLIGQTSPFTVQGLAADTAHSIVVRKLGYSEASHEFKLEAGETKELPAVELSEVPVDTGLALTSLPAGADIYVDGKKLERSTPARITDMAPGLHVVRLVSASGYQPWETQVELARGQMIELPVARLVEDPQGRSRSAASLSSASSSRSESRSRSGSSSSRRSSSRSSSRSAKVSSPRPIAAAPVAMAAAPAPAPARSGGGSMGTLRINSRPWSQVYVDGRLVGNTPQMNLALPAGSHKIKLVNPQLGMTKNVKVQIQKGQVATKIVDMVE